MKKLLPTVLPILLTVLAGLVLDYLFLPAWNFQDEGFWFYLLILSGILFFCLGIGKAFDRVSAEVSQTRKWKWKRFGENIIKIKEHTGFLDICLKVSAGILLLSFVMLFGGGIISARFFHAKAYSRILPVHEGSEADIPSVSGADAIALMDTSSAKKLASREMGSLTELVSQFEVAYDLSTVNVADVPAKLATLDYAGFFKWLSNRETGIPGYINVSPTQMDAKYVKLDKGMRYTTSAFLNDNLTRRIRWKYRTAIFDTPHFEVDESGNPYSIAPYYKKTIGLFGGTMPAGCIVANPVDGSMEKYPLSDVPTWVDIVYDGYIITEQYNDSAQLMSGYINSVIGQKGCRKITENDDGPDYGYVAKEGDIYFYTGVTSVNSDSSNLGFLFVNERTGSASFIECPGADEFSAMNAAEGEVQEKGYRASFPSLINIDGKLTYICVLKDKSGLVKMYACIDAQQYNRVAVSSSQKECIAKFTALLSGEITQEEAVSDQVALSEKDTEPRDTTSFVEKNIKIRKMEPITEDGDTWLYLADQDENIYKAKYVDVLPMLLKEEGDSITIYTDGTYFVLEK